mmetsp:Transcript_39093/g.76227  ORF Transcript_39093/g.76227 Transcript_39093/m.76227 type:complete len:158 (-) Transcript_39093:223-696(-)|eukprot:CAMPEP_0194342698 /NCGR_PEP_ID=MMETSP0171-20130528/93778_1 /TAXON_ID=218684 /ORGANISM="Corethron pennatum, Strain L29A3" /LENGTH=157 /DNA_ID=CAMNT_0039108563 /DNA_START=45 /DNA_END=518 /DNA_ORIENTATION=-
MKLLSILCFFLPGFLGTNAFVPASNATPIFARPNIDTRRYNIIDSAGSFFKNFGKQVTASHILIGPGTLGEAEAKAKLLEVKKKIGNDPEKFAQMAAEVSTCPTKKKNGELGTFFPGMMVKQFDKVCFEEEVGLVHGPISTQFGEHLIYIVERTGEE